jgi:hypothetical protein
VSTPNAGSAAGGGVRRVGLALVMVGALSVSVRGQVEAVEPLLGGMSIVLALTNDVAALLALNEVISTSRREVRRWAWAVLVLAGGTAAGLNTWHAIEQGSLPTLWAVVVGVGPVLLAMVLSHLVALVLEDAPTAAADPPVEATATTVERTAVEPPPAPQPQFHGPRVERAAVSAGGEASRAGQVQAPTLTGPGVHPPLAVVGPRVLPPEAPRAPREGGADARVARLEARLQAGEELTGATAAELVGCSPRTGRRLLRQAEDRIAARAADRDRGTG